jgi:hypothetical protein
MKLLVATTATQGHRPGDFDRCIDGELVMPPLMFCDACWSAENRDTGGCGCGRSFIGLASGKHTTTAEVREIDTTLDDYITAINDCLHNNDWRARAAAPAIAIELAAAAGCRTVGTVYRYRIGELYIIMSGGQRP